MEITLPTVYNLDSAGLFCRDTACGLLYSEFEWCVIFFPHTRAWTEADDTLRDLKDAWNQMLLGETLAVLSIGAARMYRSLSDYGSLTKYVLENVPTFSSGTSNTTAQRTGTTGNDNLPMLFPSVPQSEGSRTMHEVPIFLPADHLQVKIVPGGSTSSVTLENTKDEVDSAGWEAI